MYAEIWSILDFLGPPGVSSRLLGSHPSTSSVCAVYVCTCVYTHIHPHTLPFPLKIEMTQTTPLSFLLSKIIPHAKCSYRTVGPPHPRSPNAKQTNCTCISARAHPVTSVLANVYADVHNTRLTHAWCPKHRSLCVYTFRKNACALVHERICNGEEASLP